MKAKLKIDFHCNILHKEGTIIEKEGHCYAEVIHECIVENNPDIFELIEEPEYLRVIKKANNCDAWYNMYVGKIFKINKKYDNYFNVYYKQEKNCYIIIDDCELITKAQYIELLKKRQEKITNLINKLENVK